MDRERREYRQNLMVGLFMLMAMLALGWLVVMFGEAPTWLVGGRTYVVHVYFNELRGLTVGTEAEMNSVQVGSVSDIRPRDLAQPTLGVDVVLEIYEEYRIPDDAVARVHQAAMVGRPLVVIDVRHASADRFVATDGQGVLSGELVSPFDQLIPRDLVTTFQRTANEIGNLAEALKPAAADLHGLLEERTIGQVEADPNDQVSANLYTAIQRMDLALKHINELLGDGEMRDNLKETIANFKATSERMGTAVETLGSFAVKADSVAGKADAQIDGLMGKMVDSVDTLSRTLDHVEVVARDIADGRGTAGKLMTDPRLYESLVLTAQRLEATIGDLQALVRQWQEKGLKLQGGVLGR